MAMMTMAWLGFGALGPWALGLGAIRHTPASWAAFAFAFAFFWLVASSGLYGLAAAYLLVGGR
jgi:hypothetical protein